MSKEMEAEVAIAKEENPFNESVAYWGEPSVFACPECHGVLMQIKDGENVRFRCHTGHAYSIESLLSGFKEHTEEALWNGIRSIQETVFLMRRMADHLAEHQQSTASQALRKEAAIAQERAERVRELIMQNGNAERKSIQMVHPSVN